MQGFFSYLTRGILVDSLTLGYVVYGLLAKQRVREAYQVIEKIDVVDMSVYHGLIKGLFEVEKNK